MGLDHVSLLERAGISTSANNYYNSEVRSGRRADQGLEYKSKQDTEVGYIVVSSDIRSSRGADRGLEYTLKVRYRSWVYPNENKVFIIVSYNSVFCLVDV